MEPRSGGPGRDAEQLGDLDQGQPDVVVQHEDRALLDRQPAESPLQLVAIGQDGAAVRGRWAVERQAADLGGPRSGTSRLVVAGVDEDSMDPGLEALRIPQPRHLAPGQDEGVLQRVLGQSRVAQDPLCDRLERSTDLVHQDGERLTIAVTGLLDEERVHIDPSITATSMAADYPL